MARQPTAKVANEGTSIPGDRSKREHFVIGALGHKKAVGLSKN